LPKSGLTTASLIFQRRRFIRYPRSPINFSQPCQVVSKSRSMKTMSHLCLNHLSQKIRLSQQISSPLPVPRVRRCQGSSTRDHDGDDADCDSYHHRSGQKHLRQQDFNREIKKPSRSDPRPRAWLADHLRCKLPQHPRCIGRRLREIASTCARIYREKFFPAISAMLWPMASEAVAPGDGAFNTWIALRLPRITKSSTKPPLADTACARTPEPPGMRSLSLISGRSFCSALTKADLLRER
jgi:hypothetical protein